jgi:integrase
MKLSKKYYESCLEKREYTWHFNKYVKGYTEILYNGKIVKPPRYRCSLNTANKTKALIEVKKICKSIFYTLDDGNNNMASKCTLKYLSWLYIENQKNKTVNGRNMRETTFKWYKEQEKALLELFGENFVAKNMTLALAIEKMKILQIKNSNTTVGQHRFRYLKTVYRFASKLTGFTEHFFPNRLELLNVPNTTKRRDAIFENKEEVYTFFKSVNNYWASFAFTLMCTGMRLNEVLCLHKDWIIMNDNENVLDEITIEEKYNKTNTHRIIPIVKPLKRVLKHWIQITEATGLIFPNTLGNVRCKKASGIKNVFIKMDKKNMVNHSIRHSWVSFMVAGYPGTEREIKYFAGWKSGGDMLMHYNHSEKFKDVRIAGNKGMNQVFAFLDPVADIIINNLNEKKMNNNGIVDKKNCHKLTKIVTKSS